ncbi:Protein of unknown function [Gryllus bimaculatus]|nr:Protein of unknown function [Gryllus bimaculatus]
MVVMWKCVSGKQLDAGVRATPVEALLKIGWPAKKEKPLDKLSDPHPSTTPCYVPQDDRGIAQRDLVVFNLDK